MLVGGRTVLGVVKSTSVSILGAGRLGCNSRCVEDVVMVWVRTREERRMIICVRVLLRHHLLAASSYPPPGFDRAALTIASL